VAKATHLADTSAFTRLGNPTVRAAAAPLIAAGRVALCTPVVFELGFSARNPGDYEELISRTGAFEIAPTTQGDLHRALDIQAQLARRGMHRAVSLVDALVAAVAESRGLIALHYDADFERVAAVTGQTVEWVVPRGTAENEAGQ